MKSRVTILKGNVNGGATLPTTCTQYDVNRTLGSIIKARANGNTRIRKNANYLPWHKHHCFGASRLAYKPMAWKNERFSKDR